MKKELFVSAGRVAARRWACVPLAPPPWI